MIENAQKLYLINEMKDVKKYFQFLSSDIIENILKDLTLTKKEVLLELYIHEKEKAKMTDYIRNMINSLAEDILDIYKIGFRVDDINDLVQKLGGSIQMKNDFSYASLEKNGDLVEKMKRLEKYIPCVINDVAVIGVDKEQELFLQEQCSNIAVNLHGSLLKVGSIDPYKPENAICIQKDGMFLAYPGEYGYEIRPLISVGYISILKRLEMDCGAMMRFDIKGGDRLPLPVREKGQILTRIAQLNSKLCYVITLDGCVPGVVSDQYVPLPYIDLLKAMKRVVTKDHPDLEFDSGTLSFEYLIANYWLNDPVMEQSLALTMKNAGCNVDSLRAGIRFSSSDLGLSSVFLNMFLEINGILMPLGKGIQMEHKGDKASVEVFEEKCGELGSVLQANEDRIEELGNMDVEDVPGVVATLVKKNAFLPKKAAEKVLEDLRLQMTSGTGIDVYLALNQIIQVHSTMQKVSDERFLTMSEGVAKLIHTDFSKVTVLEEE